MNENEQKAGSVADQKSKIRERYKGIDPDELDVIPALRERVCQDDFCKFSKFKYLSAEKSPNISCLHIS